VHWRGRRDSCPLAVAASHGGVPEDGDAVNRPSDPRGVGGVDGTRTRGLRRDRPAF
jgi:hypothetical protein